MIPKALLVLLLGAALVLANPIPESNDVAVSVKPESDVGSAVDVDDTTDIDFDLFGDEEVTEATTVAIIETTTEAGTRIQRGWKKMKVKWSNWIESGKKKWKDIKHDGKEAYEKLKQRWNIVKEKGLRLIDDAKDTFNAVKGQGKEAIQDFKKVYYRIKSTWKDLKNTSHEAIDDIKHLLSDAKKDLAEVKSKWALVQKLG